MKKSIFLIIIGLSIGSVATAQVPNATLMNIVKAEDSRSYDKSLAELMKSSNPAIRARAALAVGRIGDDAAIPELSSMLAGDASTEVRTAAAFAIGEIESIKAADAILKALRDAKIPDIARARAVEAAGKIAAANPKSEQSKSLGEAILDTLEIEDKRGAKQNREVVQLALTAALRARPAETDFVVAKFLTSLDPRIRSDAANTLSRIRAKNANAALRAMLLSDQDANARANAARGLGAAEDKEAFELLLDAATQDDDSRVRVSAIRSLAGLKDAKAVDRLIERGKTLLAVHFKSKFRNPNEKSELLEIATTLGRLIPNTENGRAVTFLNELRFNDDFSSPETEIAFTRIAPEVYLSARLPIDFGYADPQIASSYAQGLAEIATTKNEDLRLRAAQKMSAYVEGMASGVKRVDKVKILRSMPDLIRAVAAFKPDNLDDFLRKQLLNDDVFIRAAAADLIADRAASKETIEILKVAFSKSLLTDRRYNDAQMLLLDALYKLDKREAVSSIWAAVNSNDHLVRKKAQDYLKEMQNDPALVNIAAKGALRPDKLRLSTYVSGSKVGQVLYTDADYRRALSRKNGTVKAVFTTEKGVFTIDFFPEDAPLTVDNFIKLARSRYFNGLEVHRVVPNFVMQDGDPRGDGNGGPGWSIRCEVNMVEFERGVVGMALSGKDTGGSQWFVTHAPQPHLDGGYTVFGKVNETGMKVVDNIVRGDKILTVRIIGR